MKLCFDSVDELKAFVKNELKGTRKGKDEADEPAVAPQGGQPVMPPLGQTQPAMGFTPPATAMQGFPGAAPTATPQVHPLVGQVISRIDGAISTGQSVDVVTGWFRNLLGPDAKDATLDQIKQVFIPRLPEPQLKQLAMQVGIPVT